MIITSRTIPSIWVCCGATRVKSVSECEGQQPVGQGSAGRHTGPEDISVCEQRLVLFRHPSWHRARIRPPGLSGDRTWDVDPRVREAVWPRAAMALGSGDVWGGQDVESPALWQIQVIWRRDQHPWWWPETWGQWHYLNAVGIRKSVDGEEPWKDVRGLTSWEAAVTPSWLQFLQVT